jgi:hypothetical protein
VGAVKKEVRGKRKNLKSERKKVLRDIGHKDGK